jgi:hypothetical protein
VQVDASSKRKPPVAEQATVTSEGQWESAKGSKASRRTEPEQTRTDGRNSAKAGQEGCASGVHSVPSNSVKDSESKTVAPNSRKVDTEAVHMSMPHTRSKNSAVKGQKDDEWSTVGKKDGAISVDSSIFSHAQQPPGSKKEKQDKSSVHVHASAAASQKDTGKEKSSQGISLTGSHQISLNTVAHRATAQITQYSKSEDGHVVNSNGAAQSQSSSKIDHKDKTNSATQTKQPDTKTACADSKTPKAPASGSSGGKLKQKHAEKSQTGGKNAPKEHSEGLHYVSKRAPPRSTEPRTETLYDKMKKYRLQVAGGVVALVAAIVAIVQYNTEEII